MYKSTQNKKYYIAIHDDATTYALVLGTFRILFDVKKKSMGTCPG